MDDYAIATLTLQCSQQFQGINQTVTARIAADGAGLPQGFSPQEFSDTLARFRIWTGNIGALSKGKASLDQRIRHSYLRDEVIRLLNQMSIVLADLTAILRGDREQQTWSKGDEIMAEMTDSDSDSDSDSDTNTGTDTEKDNGSQLVTESGQLELMLNDFVKSLLKLSLLIQKSSRRAKFARSSREKPYETNFDIFHVLESFPHAVNNTLLLEKLGKANAQRRQWLSYRRRHREKLSSPGASVANQFLQEDNFLNELGFQQPADLRSTTSFSSQPPLSPIMTTGSTTATTFYNESVDAFAANTQEEDASEVSFSASSISGTEKARIEIPIFPSEGASGQPFECPFCCTIISVPHLSAWVRHVHADLASYVCTFESCSEPPFESRIQWFDHEMEFHRRIWSCPYCEENKLEEQKLERHIKEQHSNRAVPFQVRGLMRQSSLPQQRVLASSCPLCDYDNVLRERRATLSLAGPIMIKPEQLRSHLGRHLEQLAIFVLPKSALVHDVEDDDEDEEGSVGNLSSADEEDGPQDEHLHQKLNTQEITDILTSESSNSPLILHEAPALALGWQPPHDFTPPFEYFETDDEELTPRREESTFGGDLFTPGWVRGYDKNKEGWCGRCDVGHLVNIPSGVYEFHLTYLHGLPYTGLPLPRPSAIREIAGQSGSWEAFCDMCQGWRTLRRTKQGWNWWRHCLTEHDSSITNFSGEKALSGKSVQPFESESMRVAVKCIRLMDSSMYTHLLNVDPEMLTTKNADGRTLLHFAAEAGHLPFVRLILETINAQIGKGGMMDIINSQSSKGFTPLMLAVGQGNETTVEELAKNGADIHLLASDGKNALDIAAHAGYPSIAKILIAYGADVEGSRVFRQIYLVPQKANTKQTDDMPLSASIAEKLSLNWSDLMAAASENDVSGVLEYLKGGIDVEETAKDGSTALTIAILRGNIKVAEVLIEHGAHLNAINAKGWTALMTATRDANPSAVKFLLDHGADVNHLSPDHWTALAEAAQSGHTDILQELLERGADTEVRSSHDWTPLMHACYRGDKACVERLLEAGAKVESGSQRDETPMLLAAAAGHTEILRLLLAAGGQPDAAWARKTESREGQESIERTYQLGWTPLMTACQNGHLDAVQLLLAAGANTKPRSPMTRNALEIARENGRTAIVGLLEKESGDLQGPEKL